MSARVATAPGAFLRSWVEVPTTSRPVEASPLMAAASHWLDAPGVDHGAIDDALGLDAPARWRRLAALAFGLDVGEVADGA